MNIALLNKKVIIQKQQTVADRIGNHSNEWGNYHRCYATISGEGGQEVIAAGTVNDHADCQITVRWCKKLSAINSLNYRIVMDKEIYNILSVDHLSYKRNALRFRCKKENR